MSNTFFVYLPSDNLDYIENRPNNYRVHLPRTLELKGNWVCGLHSISYPYSWPSTIGTLDDQWINIYFNDKKGNEQILRVPIPKGSHKTVHELQTFLSSALKYQANSIESLDNERNFVEQPQIISENIRKRRAEPVVEPPSANNPVPIEPPRNNIMQKAYGIRPRNNDKDIMGNIGVGKKKKEEEEGKIASSSEIPSTSLDTQNAPESKVSSEQKLKIIENILIGNIIGDALESSKKEAKTVDSLANQNAQEGKVSNEQKLEIIENILIGNIIGDALESSKKEAKTTDNENAIEENPTKTNQSSSRNIMQSAYGIRPRDYARDIMQSAYGIKPRDQEKDIMQIQGIKPRVDEKSSTLGENYNEIELNKLKESGMSGTELRKIIESIEIEYSKEFDRFVAVFKDSSITHISFTSQLGYVLGFENYKLIKNNDIAKYGCDLRGGFSSFGVYTKGLTENMVIGNTLNSLLRVVSISGAILGEYTEKFIIHRFFAMFYKEMSKKSN